MMTTVRDQLDFLIGRRLFITQAAANADGNVCFWRRQILAAFDDPHRDPDELRYLSRPIHQATAREVTAALVVALEGAPDPVRRAVRDELGLLLEGTEDILVTVTFTVEEPFYGQVELLNAWLHQADDDTLVRAVHDWYEVGIEDVLHFYADQDDDLYEVMAEQWVDPLVTPHRVVAWIRRHRPHLADQL